MAARVPWMERPSLLEQCGKGLLLAVLAVLMIFPFVYVVSVSFSSYIDIAGGNLVLFPRNPTWLAYQTVLNGGIVQRALLVSAGITLVGTLLNTVFTVLMAYGLSRPSMPGSRLLLYMVLFTFLFAPGIIPNYLVVKQLGLLNTYQSLILPTLIAAFNLVILRSFFMGIPSELIDCARLDGASDLQILWHIMLPLSKAVLAVVALFYGVEHWNEFFNAILYLDDSTKWPIQLVLRQYVLGGSSLAAGLQMDPSTPPPPQRTVQMAVVVIATVPILLVYPFLQRYFTRGVLTGAIKG